jgi:hypothetical protein
MKGELPGGASVHVPSPVEKIKVGGQTAPSFVNAHDIDGLLDGFLDPSVSNQEVSTPDGHKRLARLLGKPQSFSTILPPS